MKCTEFIDLALAIFDKRQSAFERYAYEVDWLQQRRVKWSSNKIRIGVIGVTSSGKSTLINAILGDQLLSMAVKPSSSQLVSCSKGDKRRAIISIKNSQDIILEGKHLNLGNMKKYSDENENRHNKENVTDIQLITPSFDLGDDTLLIDSAGLDAYKLESHEKLSLEVLLPTIDMCIFVTTLKTNSDEKTLAVLNVIAKHKCPLVIVQNMLDSIEPSADGKKTKEMVAHEHKKRLQRIVDASNIVDKSSVSIIQVSAIHAMRARCQNKREERESHYKEFIQLMNDMIKAFIPKIDKERCTSAFSRYSQLVADEEMKTSGVMVVAPKFKYEGVKERLHRDYNVVYSSVDKEISNLSAKEILNSKTEKGSRGYSSIFSAVLHQSDNACELTKDNVDHKIDMIKTTVKKCEENILDIISDFNKELSNTAKILGMPLRDLVKIERLETISEPQKVMESKTRYWKEEKSGFGGGAARFFGKIFDRKDWGYEEVPYTVKELDSTRTSEELIKYIDRAQRVYKQSIDGWIKNIHSLIENFDAEIDRYYDSFMERQKKIEEAEDVLWIISELKKLLSIFDMGGKDIDRYPVSVSKNLGEDSPKLFQVPLSGYQIGLLNISQMVLHKATQQSLNHCIQAVQAPQRAIIIGWDVECLRNFVIRFFGAVLSEENCLALEKSGTLIVEDILFLFSPDVNHLKQIQNENAPASFYILINAQQDGAARNQISKLILKDNVKTNDRIFFVVQDFDSLITSSGVQEMKANIYEYYDEFGINRQKGIVLINDDNPVYNIAFTQSQLEPCSSIADEQALLMHLQNRFKFLFNSKVSNIVAELIRVERKEWAAG